MRKKEAKKVKVKKLRKEVQEKIAVALADYKTGLPEEKYSKIVKKASKMFVSNYASANAHNGNGNGKRKEKPAKVEVTSVQESVQQQ